MRYFEYIGGTSEKFWEISSDGNVVTVRFGRIGTSGQTQTKDLGTATAASAHVAKLVSEKVAKGYVESGSASAMSARPASQPTTPGPVMVATPADEAVPEPEDVPPPADMPPVPETDEDLWVVPTEWWTRGLPVRGRGPRLNLTPSAEAGGRVAASIERDRARIESILDNANSDREIVEAARLQLGVPGSLLRRGRQESSPLGAAAIAAVLGAVIGYQSQSELALLADDWVGSQGPTFASAALMELAGITIAAPQRHARFEGAWLARRAPGDITVLVLPACLRMRALLAAASDDDHAAAVGEIDRRRTASAAHRAMAAVVVPDRSEWVDEAIADVAAAQHLSPTVHLIASASTAEQLATVSAASDAWWVLHSFERVYTAAANVGPDVLGFLLGLLDRAAADARRRLLAMIAALPTDAAMSALIARLDEKYVEPALLDAMHRFPRRAARLLAGAAAGNSRSAARVHPLLRGHMISHPDAALARDLLDPATQSVIDQVLGSVQQLDIASDDVLPPILVSPPWVGKRARHTAAVVEVVPRRHAAAVVWRAGEREQFEGRPAPRWGGPVTDWQAEMQQAVKNRWRMLSTLASAPVDVARPYVLSEHSLASWDAAGPLRTILSRHGDDAIQLVVTSVDQQPTSLADVLLPITGTDVAERMGGWFGRTKRLRAVAVDWFDRHPLVTADTFVPVALSKPGKPRSNAEAILRLLVGHGHRAVVEESAAAYGSDAASAVQMLLEVDPLTILPATIPKLPAWLDVGHLAPVLTSDRRYALPPSAMQHICTMLALGTPEVPYAGIDLVKGAVDRQSLAAMGWDLFERWRGAGYPSRDGWVLTRQAVIGDDETARKLAQQIKAWPGEGGHSRAVTGLDVLAGIGTDAALIQLHNISQKAKFKGLKGKAEEKIGEVAEELGLTADQLADRLVPDFGIAPEGTIELDYGPRQFVVGFDEQLKPVIFDSDGSRRKSLPKPGASDDPVLAPDAEQRYKGLAKDVKTVAADQIRRFERAMTTGRRWPASEFRTLFVDHPLLWHIVRRLLWATFDGDRVGTAFRVAEDRTFADADDSLFELAGDATVGIAHPLHLGADLPAWSELFADYEILQPFAQLARDVHALTDEERAATQLHRLDGVTIPTGKVLGLSHRGWERAAPQDAGIQPWVWKDVGPQLSVVAELDPGIIAGAAMEWKEQKLQAVYLSRSNPEWGGTRSEVAFGELELVAASELLRDLEGLRP